MFIMSLFSESPLGKSQFSFGLETKDSISTNTDRQNKTYAFHAFMSNNIIMFCLPINTSMKL